LLILFYFATQCTFAGHFKNYIIGNAPTTNNGIMYITMECIEAFDGGPPFWEPMYHHDEKPFPECINMSKYKNTPVFACKQISVVYRGTQMM